MIYLPPGNCRNKRSLLKKGSLWFTKCAFLEWSLMINLVFWGLCFCLFVFCFSLSQKTTIIFGQCFLFVSVLLFLWNILPKERQKHWKHFCFSCLCLAGSFSLSSKLSTIQKAKKQTKKKLATPENKQRLSLQKSQSVGLLTLQSWIVSPKMLNCSPLAYRVTEHLGGGCGV